MAVTKSLSKLLRLREMEEEQIRMELESAVQRRNCVSQQFDSIRDSQQQGRERFVSAIYQANAALRSGATLELELSGSQCVYAAERLVASELELERQRAEYLERRTSRRQVETLVERKAAVDRTAGNRRAQQMLDEWYGRKLSATSAAQRLSVAKNAATE